MLRRVRFADPSDSSDISEEDDVDDVDDVDVDEGAVTGERRVQTLPRGAVTGERRVQTLPRVLQWDLGAVRWIVRQRESSPLLEALIVSTTSRSRLQDITLLLWLVFIAMLPEFGLPYLWICLANLLVVGVLQFMAQVERPVDLDSSLLLAPSCTDPDTNGFPCVDSHMAIVVLLPVIQQTENAAVQLVFVGIIIFISFTRLCLATRFVTQVVASWLTGLTGIILGNHGHLVIKTYRLPRIYHTMALLFVAAVILAVVGTWVENNDSRILGVPKQDFMDVLGNIMASGGATEANASRSSEQGSSARTRQFSGRLRQAADEDEQDIDDEIMGRKDSFFYLMRGIRARQLVAKRQRRLRQAQAAMRRAAPTHPRPFSI
ncbi:hypothetical protein P43SY_002440 [Pythium insidiosum]|uniref:Phosphatidic acid phosphatase type 2/haloperoxidase domain-containing protein n=1 Tax=Pythium insidiosum TaxID=114742 RepID=A0AAD5Q7R1_PYTIN|nr:hypothetical protein P43SY_002440 [Pythium insidiosum]